MKFTFKVTQDAIKKAFEEVVDQTVKETTIKGFRKGKAPRDKVISHVGQAKLQKQAVERALPEAYIAEIKKRGLNSISYPNIQLKKGVEGEDFEFEAEVAQAPEVKLGKYKDKIKGVLAADKIWTPEKEAKKGDKDQELTREQQVNKVARALLEAVEVDLPELLVKREVDRLLTQLLDQVNSLGMNIDDYLASRNLTHEKLREEYRKSAQQSLTLEFALMEVAKDMHIDVATEELNQAIEAVGDEKVKEQLKQPNQRANLFTMLLKQKVIEELIKLAK